MALTTKLPKVFLLPFELESELAQVLPDLWIDFDYTRFGKVIAARWTAPDGVKRVLTVPVWRPGDNVHAAMTQLLTVIKETTRLLQLPTDG